MSKRTNSVARDNLPTIGACLVIWNERTDISNDTKRRVRQDVLKACKWMGRSPDDLIAHPANLNPRLRRLTPGMVGAGDRRITNVRNSIKTLLQTVDYGNGKSFKTDLTPDWAQQASVIPDRYSEISVRCMMQFATARGIAPSEFSEAHSAALLQALLDDRLHSRPLIIHQNCIRASNKLGTLGVGWAVPPLTSPRYAKTRIRKWADLPSWCHHLTRQFLDRGTTDDPYDLSKPFKKWRPASIHTYETQLRRFFSAAREIVPDFDRPRTWRDIATVEFAEQVLRTFTAANDGKNGWVMVSAMATLLGQIARNPDFTPKLALDEVAKNGAVAAEFTALATRLHNNKALSSKSRERASLFRDETNLAKLFLLPFALERELSKSRLRRRRIALLAQWAVALMILTFAPLRISTLSQLADRHLKWSRPGQRGQLTLELDASMMKGGEPASIPLPQECARLIKLYCDKYRADVVGESTDFLFPGESASSPKKTGVLSTQLTRLIEYRTGLPVNPHLYRHLVHIVILRRFPGAYVMISRVLTHRSLDTAVRNYAYFDTELSLRAYQHLVSEVQTGTRSLKIDSPNHIANSHTEYDRASRKSSR